MNDLKTLGTQRETMKAYLKMKMEEEDWHGVQDAASDLRDIDSKLEMLGESQLPEAKVYFYDQSEYIHYPDDTSCRCRDCLIKNPQKLAEEPQANK